MDSAVSPLVTVPDFEINFEIAEVGGGGLLGEDSRGWGRVEDDEDAVSFNLALEDVTLAREGFVCLPGRAFPLLSSSSLLSSSPEVSSELVSSPPLCLFFLENKHVTSDQSINQPPWNTHIRFSQFTLGKTGFSIFKTINLTSNDILIGIKVILLWGNVRNAGKSREVYFTYIRVSPPLGSCFPFRFPAPDSVLRAKSFPPESLASSRDQNIQKPPPYCGNSTRKPS